MLVVDASFAIEASLVSGAFDRLRDREAVAPALMWSEATSVLHEMLWRRAISGNLAEEAVKRLAASPIAQRRPALLWTRAWKISESLGWAKTYDAEYIALAQLLDCPVLTTDSRLARAAAHIVSILAPADL